MIDCLLIGFNDGNLEEYVDMLRVMGTHSGAFKDLDLAIIDYDNKPYRSLDILTRLYNEDRNGSYKIFHNSDFLWPVMTYLGTYLSRRGFSFDYVNLFQLEKEKLKEKLLKEDILTIAVTTTLYVSPHPIQEIISFIRKYNKTAKIIVGGPFIAGQPKMLSEAGLKGLFKSLGADFYVISSEGEAALVNLLNALKSGSDLNRVPNIAYKEGESYEVTQIITESNSLEENMVDYSLFPVGEIDQFVTTRTAKSCPFACSFCGFPERAGKYTYMSVEAVERELNAIRDIGNVSTLTFIDDTFNVPKARFKELLRMMIKNKYPFKWNCLYRSDHGDEEAIELMGKAGCEGVFLGIESGSDSMLATMNKTARRKHYLKAIPLLKQAGVSTYASLIIGFPGETYETVQETIDLIEEAKPDYFRAQLWYCDPVTPIWEKRDEYHIRGSAFNWSHETMDVKTACDYIDRIFLSVENSIWLPQYGFEQWSTFYLQRKGMTVNQINTFLKCFNAIIKEKIAQPGKEHDARLIENLKRSCQFDRNLEPEPEVIEAYTGLSYQAAERFWVDECGTKASSSALELVRQGSVLENEELASLPLGLEKAILQDLQSKLGASMSEIMLTAFSILLSRLSSKQEILIATEIRNRSLKYVAPLRLRPKGEISFRDFVESVRQKIEQSSRHQLYGFFTATNPTVMAEHGYSCPVLDAGYSETESEVLAGPQAAMNYHPAVNPGVALMLKAARSENETDLSLVYSRSALAAETVERIGAYITSIFQEAWADEQTPVGEILVGSGKAAPHAAIYDGEAEVFHF